MTMLSEAEAWREIARRLASGRRMEWGLCAMANQLEIERRIPIELNDAMHRRTKAHAPLSPYRFGAIESPTDDSLWFAFPPATHRRERVLAALFLALEAEDEAQ